MTARLTILAACLLLSAAGCTRYDPLDGLSQTEIDAVDVITRDPAVRLWRTERDRDGHLIVWTRQGSGSARYRVIAPIGDDQAADIQTLDLHPEVRRY